MRISTAIEFTAYHAVKSDPKYSKPHPHKWRLRAAVGGPLVPPGWVMEFEALVDILREANPRCTRSLNAMYELSDATNENLVTAMSAVVVARLPGAVTLVALDLFELDEAGNETNGAHWP